VAHEEQRRQRIGDPIRLCCGMAFWPLAAHAPPGTQLPGWIHHVLGDVARMTRTILVSSYRLPPQTPPYQLTTRSPPVRPRAQGREGVAQAQEGEEEPRKEGELDDLLLSRGAAQLTSPSCVGRPRPRPRRRPRRSKCRAHSWTGPPRVVRRRALSLAVCLDNGGGGDDGGVERSHDTCATPLLLLCGAFLDTTTSLARWVVRLRFRLI
jgi:hypothetical protein